MLTCGIGLLAGVCEPVLVQSAVAGGGGRGDAVRSVVQIHVVFVGPVGPVLRALGGIGLATAAAQLLTVVVGFLHFVQRAEDIARGARAGVPVLLPGLVLRAPHVCFELAEGVVEGVVVTARGGL